MKIAFLSYFYLGLDNFGASTYVQKYLNVLSRMNNVSIDFYCPYPIQSFKKIKNVHYIYIKTLNIPFIRFFQFAFKISQLLKLRKYDIVHSSSGAGMFVKNVDFETFYHYEPFSIPNFNAWIGYTLSRVSLKRSRHIFAISEQSVTELIQFENRRRELISIITNPIDCMIFNQNHNFSTKKKEILKGKDEKLILSVGLLINRKNPFLLIKTLDYIIKKGINAKLLIIGNGPLKQKMILAANEKKILDNIIFIHSTGEIYPYYCMADLLLTPSKKEGFGFLYLEGPACGCKFVGFPTGISPVAAKKNLGIVVNDEVSFMESAHQILLSGDRTGQEEFNFIYNNFSMEKFGKRLISSYQKYLNIRDGRKF
ncbi:glycosyltransferase [Candidatus Lokiarchaeum ossiferum]